MLLGTSFLALFWSSFVGGSSCGATSTPTGAPRIALVDSLSSEYPNPDFVARISLLAGVAGYSFDYYGPGQMTVDSFAHLSEKGYSILILRTHGSTTVPVITTSEPYSQYRRVGDQLSGSLGDVSIDGHQFFALGAGFVKNGMCGRFPGTLVLMMGCAPDGTSDLAHAFVTRGARGFVGWSGFVTLSHTDEVFQSLAQLLLEGVPASQAIQSVMHTLGPDLETGSHLVFST